MSLVIQSRVELRLFASNVMPFERSNNFDIPIWAATWWWSYFSFFGGIQTESSAIPSYFIAIVVPTIHLVCQLLLLPVILVVCIVQYSVSNVHNWPSLHLSISFKFCLLITFSEMEHDIRIRGTIYRHSFCWKTIVTVSNENEERVRAWSGIEICILQWLAFVNSFSVGATKNNSWCLRDIAMTNTWEMRFKFQHRETRKPAQYAMQLDNEIENVLQPRNPKFQIVEHNG